jgi:excisionase family DNA binding protein
VSKKRRIEITIEAERSVIFRKKRNNAQARCAHCAAQVRMLTPEEAALVAGVSQRTINRWVEAGKLHFTETPEGLLLICLNSLVSDRRS